jgi:hypothetical protein
MKHDNEYVLQILDRNRRNDSTADFSQENFFLRLALK